MMTVHPDQDDPNCNHSQMNCRACIQLPLYVDGIYASIDTQMLKIPYSSIPLGVFFDNRINPDTGTFKKEKREIFSGCCTKTFKAKLLCYINEVLFIIVKTALKDTF